MRRAPLIISILALVLAATGVAVSAPKDSSGVIHGCYNQAHLDEGGGALYVVNAGTQCGEDYPDALTWSASGPAGATGATGAQGPTGVQGPVGPAGPQAPAEQVPTTQIQKVDNTGKKVDSAKDKLEEAAKKLQDAKSQAATQAEMIRFTLAVNTMIRQLTSGQELQLAALRMMSPSAARDLAIKRAEAQIKAAEALLASINALVKDRALTRVEMEKLLARLPKMLAAIADSQSAITDGIAARLGDAAKTKKP